MLFPTFDFLLFAIPVLLGYWMLSRRPLARVLLLLGASYFFYMAGPKMDPPPTPWYFAGLLVFSTVLDYASGWAIHRQASALESPVPARIRRARLVRGGCLAASVVGNLGLLGYFKYTDFFATTVTDVAQALGIEATVVGLDVLLPVGISFYTFQSLSYTIDVWRGRLRPEPSFLKFALFVSFFPQLVAGPIVRANEFLPQLHRRPHLSGQRMEEGMFRILKGLVKKVVLGDWIAAQVTDPIFAAPEAYTTSEILLALYAFTLQLYADFSGYSDIAIGVARLMGFTIPENFDRPHQARHIGEFWRRWHMTLSTWLRDYLFFPLGGSRGSPARTYFNLWLTMFLVGMWHYKTGTSWNFVIYANLQAGAILFNRYSRLRDRSTPLATQVLSVVGLAVLTAIVLYGLGAWGLELDPGQAVLVAGIGFVAFVVVTAIPMTGTPVNTAVHVLLTFHFTVLSRIFFRAESFAGAKAMTSGLLSLEGGGIRPGLIELEVWIALIFGLAYHFTPKRWVDGTMYRTFRRLPGWLVGVGVALLCLALMLLSAQTPRAFIYFQF